MPLITTIAEVKKYTGIDANTNIDTLKPFIDEVELLFIVPLLGQAFYDVLIADYNADLSQMTEDNQKVMPYIQRAESYYVAYLSINQVGVNFGDMGIQQQHGENSTPAPLWKVEKLQMSFISTADIHAEKLLEFLEINATVSKYNTWYASAFNTKTQGYMVNSAIVADEYVDINKSRRIFMRMKKRIIEIESSYIKKLICQDQYDELVTQIKTDSITANNQKLIDKIRPVVAKMALYLTIPALRISISDKGITIFSSSDGVVAKQIADRQQVAQLLESLKAEPFGYESDEQELRQFFEDNIDDYPLIKDSECYTIATDPGPTWQPENSADNKHFSV